MMTVKKMIEKLSKCPANAKVDLGFDYGGETDQGCVTICTLEVEGVKRPIITRKCAM